MSNIITAGNATNNGTSISSDTSGVLELKTGSTPTTALSIDASQNLQFNSGYGSVATAYGCRAWVNFNGVTGAIRASGNVSSITKNAVGDYTVNFTTAMPDVNYAPVYGATASLTAGNWAFVTGYLDGQTTTTLRILIKNDAGTGIDSPTVAVAIFR